MLNPKSRLKIILSKPWLKIIASMAALVGIYLIKLYLVQRFAPHRDIFFENADSLVLPLVAKSINQGFSFKWIFSSQLFLFPEALLYFISTIFTNNFRVALVINGLLNLTAIWLILSFIFKRILAKNTPLASCFALSALTVSALVGMSLLERSPVFFITQFFTTTYYAGVIICGLMLLAIIIAQLQSRSLKLILFSFAITLLGVFSNPLLVVQFIVPLFLLIGLGYLVNILDGKNTVSLALGPLLGTAVGFVGRNVFAAFLETGVGSYYQPGMIPSNIKLVKEYLVEAGANRFQSIEIILVFCLLILAIFLFLLFIKLYTNKNHFTKNDLLKARQTYLLTGFGALAPAVTVVITLLSGNYSPRYFLPVFIMPLLTLLILAFRYAREINYKYVYALFLGIILLGVATIPSNLALAQYYPNESACFDTKMKKYPRLAGVASFWNARKLHLYNRNRIPLQQVLSTGEVYPHLNNLAEYESRRISFVIVDRRPSLRADITADQARLRYGEPTQIEHCPSFSIYVYSPENNADQKLNEVIKNSLNQALSARLQN